MTDLQRLNALWPRLSPAHRKAIYWAIRLTARRPARHWVFVFELRILGG
jgi:hypothetical protein